MEKVKKESLDEKVKKYILIFMAGMFELVALDFFAGANGIIIIKDDGPQWPFYLLATVAGIFLYIAFRTGVKQGYEDGFTDGEKYKNITY
ncbi:MAG: hypothetical protein US57_C0002G0037 [Candidatus Moranbacteria bacterium GW2011_GWC2_37_73]|nr:MAG: hypothetical protein UR95_C0002G0135 [Parcubacteria group bacterium GW2011_GWC1_36_108]KKQ01022.1 MAG: hypothetical protein US09_C0003G0022 [Candidatus Moranbacteria bacterium GW2011_GWD1_36_198]KKQ02424.1 MAG: hypothetical protein US10_C0001G0022 [Candidatus Moranbacteria bacterium GW2011_GWD2_36_198]KKQ40330.1 MAG: hypothetical protein US57_C0002G0037 [Candidatus Moranbacteria bacterium GW2011_GWC2_37_73]